MPTIRFQKNLPALEVSPGANLMESLLAAGLPVASSCLGDGICSKCKILVVVGADQLSPINAREQMLRDRLRLAPNLRISCQTSVNGDVTIDASYW